MATIKKYNGSIWENAVVRKYGTASEIITLPTTIYADGTAITAYTLKGNTVQNGTPTPSNPVPVVGVGELETTGEHTGEYKIPISSGGVTTNIYLTEQLMKIGDTVDSLVSAGTVTYNIKKLVLTGEEQWSAHQSGNGLYSLSSVNDYLVRNINISICSHYNTIENVSGYSAVTDKTVTFYALAGSAVRVMYLRDTDFANVTALKSFLSNQYANGTPVTVYYILASPTTETVTAPSIPTAEGANSITVDTTVQPSEFTATWTGWHDAYVKERSENLFDKNAVTLGKEISGMGYINNPDYFITDFIPIASGETYSKSGSSGTSLVFGGSVLLYDEADISKTPLYKISAGTGEQFTIPQGDYNYMVLNGRVNIIDLGMINQGSTTLPYAPYWE